MYVDFFCVSLTRLLSRVFSPRQCEYAWCVHAYVLTYHVYLKTMHMDLSVSHVFRCLIWFTDWCASAWNFFLSYGCWKLLDGLINKWYFVLLSTVLLDFNPCNVCILIFVALVMTFSLSPVIGVVVLNLCVMLSRGDKSYFVLTL